MLHRKLLNRSIDVLLGWRVLLLLGRAVARLVVQGDADSALPRRGLLSVVGHRGEGCCEGSFALSLQFPLA